MHHLRTLQRLQWEGEEAKKLPTVHPSYCIHYKMPPMKPPASAIPPCGCGVGRQGESLGLQSLISVGSVSKLCWGREAWYPPRGRQKLQGHRNKLHLPHILTSPLLIDLQAFALCGVMDGQGVGSHAASFAAWIWSVCSRSCGIPVGATWQLLWRSRSTFSACDSSVGICSLGIYYSALFTTVLTFLSNDKPKPLLQ